MTGKDTFIHPNALVETTSIGPGTRVWAFAHISRDVTIGEECNIGDHCFIESGVVIGDRVTIKNGISIWRGVTIEDEVFVGPNVVFVNDTYPRSKIYREEITETLIQKGASIGANATLLGGITIGQYALIGAGSVVTKSVDDFELVYGNPARQQGWVSRAGEKFSLGDGDKLIREGFEYSLIGGRINCRRVE
jgi:acetyltransferase-like isoleucine patch superfamily enzyme